MEDFKNLQETQLSSQPIFDGDVLHIFKDTIRLPNGKQATREYTVHHGAVCILPLLENGEETGAVAGELIPLGRFYPTCAYSTEVIHMYLARQLTFGERELDEDEFLNVFRLPLRELVDRVLRGEIPDAKTQAAALRVWCMLQEGKLS